MKRKVIISLLVSLWLLIFLPIVFAAEENFIPQAQLQNIRYSLAQEKNRLVFDFTLPFSYQVTSQPGSQELTIVVNCPDGRIKKEPLNFNDLAVKQVTLLPDFTNPDNTIIKISLNYRLPYQITALTNPERLVIDLEKIFEEKKETKIVPGLDYIQIYAGTPSGPLQVDLLKIDLNNSDLELKPVLAQKGTSFSKEKVSELAAKTNAVGAINGTYFATDGTPLGLLVSDNKLITYPWGQRTALGITGDKKVFIDNVGLVSRVSTPEGKVLTADGVNCARGENQLIIYTNHRGLTTKTNESGLELAVLDGKVVSIGNGNLPIPKNGYVVSAHGNKRELLQGMVLESPLQVELSLTKDWLNQGVVHMLSGGPRLVKNGKVFITAQEEKFRSDITQGRAPRSALGVTADQKLLLVAVSGRQPSRSIGLTLNELAQLMIKNGVLEGMNLDGGGSTTLLVQGQVVNLPSDGQERKVSNALVVNYLGQDQVVKNNLYKQEEKKINNDDKPNWL